VNNNNANLTMVAQGVDNLKRWSNGQKIQWNWIETTQITAGTGATPTPAQVKAEVWMSLVHGANGY